MSESVTLKSYFYEVLIPSSQKNTSSPIEDILHHVSISFMKKLALYKCFNPRTHTGCDICYGDTVPDGCKFQSTHPHGVRLSLTYENLSLSKRFNPRTHTGCDFVGTTHVPSPRSFNPRTHTGCDDVRLRRRFTIFGVSIHAPTRGATCSIFK